MVDTGQVKFSIVADNLKDTLELAKELEQVLNGINGKAVTAKAGSRVLHAKQKALRMAANIEKRYAIQKHNQEVKDAKESDKLEEKRYRNAEKAMNKRSKLLQKEQANKEKAQRAEDKLEEKRYRNAMKAMDKRAKDLARRRAQEEKDAELAARAPLDYRKNLQTSLVNWGAQMQTLGSTLQRITSPFTNVYRGLAMGVGYRLLGKVTESISGAFSRYDTIKTYSKVLTNLGVDATKKFSIAGEQATDVYHNLENAVLGLPTGIDEIIESMRRYAGATGEAERATKLAIAANNAYIAGHMGDREKLFTERQLVALAGGAELSSNQWDSLRRNAPLAMKVVAKDMKMSVQEMVDSLKQGRISGEKFLDVFIKAGTEGKIKNAAQVMKQTWDAVAQNFQNRMNAMGEGILNALDSVFKKMDGRTFLQHVLGVDKNGKYIGGGIRGVIDDMSQSVQKWIKANPEKITSFFDNLSKIDWKGIVAGFADFGFMMGRVYAALAKTFGTGGLVKTMLWTNLAGKGIQAFGGLLKGSAGIVSWIATLAKFGGTGKMGRAIKNGAELAKGHGAIVGATKTVATAAMTWQQVASKAVAVAAIPAMAWSLKEVALALQAFGEVDMSKLSVGKFAAAAGAITAFGGLAAALGALSTGHVVGWITTASTAVGIAEVASISKTMKWLGEGLGAIADAEVPDASKIKRVMESIKQIEGYFKSRNIFESIGTIFDSWTKSSEFKAVKNATDAFKGITDMVSLKLPKGWRDKATSRFDAVMDFVGDIEFMVSNLDTRLMARAKKAQGKFAGSQKGTSKAKTNANAYSYIKQQLRDFADQMQAISDGFGYLDSALLSVKKFNKIYANLNHLKKGGYQPFSFDAVFYQVKNFAEQIYKFAQPSESGMSVFEMVNKAAEQLKSGNFENITGLFNSIPKMIKSMTKAYKSVAKSTLLSGEADSTGNRNMANPMDIFSQRIKPLFTAINAINTEMPTDISGLKRLKGIQKSLNRIPAVINQLVGIMNNSQIGSINTGAITEIVSKITAALDAFEPLNGKKIKISVDVNGKVNDNASKPIASAYDKIKEAIEKIEKLGGNHPVRISVNVNAIINGVDEAVEKMNTAARRLEKALRRLNAAKSGGSGGFTGGYGGHAAEHHNGGKIRPIYRAHGGSIFNSRGTDIVPAMLTPGEYVVNRMAASRIGDETLWRLNHMDLAGALRSLSARVGQSIVPRGNVINNTTNNTRNNNVSIHNNSSAGVGLGRANRWVMSL